MGGVESETKGLQLIVLNYHSSLTIIEMLMQGLEETMSTEQSKVEPPLENSEVNNIARYIKF